MIEADGQIVYIMVYTQATQPMAKTAKLFKNGRSQAVRLPAEFRFDGDEVYIRKDPVTGDVVLSAKPGAGTLGDLLARLEKIGTPEIDLMEAVGPRTGEAPPDPFRNWEE